MVRAALLVKTSTILVAEVGEAPDISQADNLPSHRQDVFQLVVPLPSLQGLVLLLLLLADGAVGARADGRREGRTKRCWT